MLGRNAQDRRLVRFIFKAHGSADGLPFFLTRRSEQISKIGVRDQIEKMGTVREEAVVLVGDQDAGVRQKRTGQLGDPLLFLLPAMGRFDLLALPFRLEPQEEFVERRVDLAEFVGPFR